MVIELEFEKLKKIILNVSVKQGIARDKFFNKTGDWSEKCHFSYKTNMDDAFKGVFLDLNEDTKLLMQTALKKINYQAI